MEFKQAVITKDGRALMAKLLAGEKTSFIKIKVSSAKYEFNQLEELTEIEDVKQEAEVNSYLNNATTVYVTAGISNEGLSTGYYVETVGLYAQDPEKGEILYSVSTAKEHGYLPADTGVSKSGFNFKIYTEVSNAENVELMVNPASFVTISDLNVFKVDYYDKQEIDEVVKQVKQYTDEKIADLETGDEPVVTYTQQQIDAKDKAVKDFATGELKKVNDQIKATDDKINETMPKVVTRADFDELTTYENRLYVVLEEE